MEILKRERKIVKHKGYGGVCENCGVAVTADELMGVELFRNDILSISFPFDELYCPNCYTHIYFIKVWKSLNVTSEIQQVKP